MPRPVSIGKDLLNRLPQLHQIKAVFLAKLHELRVCAVQGFLDVPQRAILIKHAITYDPTSLPLSRERVDTERSQVFCQKRQDNLFQLNLKRFCDVEDRIAG